MLKSKNSHVIGKHPDIELYLDPSFYLILETDSH